MDRQVICCPYCGEQLEIVVDPSVRRQEYIEDCQICCRPMILRVTFDEAGEEVHIDVRTDDA